MPVGLAEPEALLAVPGVLSATARAGIRQRGRDDVALITCDAGTRAAAVFTRNRFSAAPVVLAREHLAQASPRALVVNSGCANAGTGRAGYMDAVAICNAAAARLRVQFHEVLPFSTGVIGSRLPVEKVSAAVAECVDGLNENGWLAAARAIMTTDTLAKGCSRTVIAGGDQVTITGIAKGSGMIRPDLATMLAFVATDAKLAPDYVDRSLRQAVDLSFNRITVDGDTSTNDACVLLATGRAGEAEIGPGSVQGEAFQQGLDAVMQELAQAIVRDAEGATKFVTIEVSGANTAEDAAEVAFTVAHSPLVKTALFASDANWGRILAAVGRAPVQQLDIDRVGLRINGQAVLVQGQPAPDYTEAAGVAAMAPAEIHIDIDLAIGDRSATVWTSDLSFDYVRINAEYRT